MSEKQYYNLYKSAKDRVIELTEQVDLWKLLVDEQKDRIKEIEVLNKEMYEALKRDELLANVAILATPSGPKRNKLTEINLLRLQAIAKAEGKS